MIPNVTCPLQFCIQMLPGDSTFVRTWYELAEFHQNLCTLISITALGCFLCHSSPSSLLIWTTLLVLLANKHIDLQNHVPAYFPEHLPMVEMKCSVVFCIPEKGISQEKKRPTEIKCWQVTGAKWQEYSFTDFVFLLKWTNIYWKIIWQDSTLNQLKSNAGNTKYILLCVWKCSKKKSKDMTHLPHSRKA